VTRALQANASGLIAAHNHPSGSEEPSESDRIFAKDLISALRPLGLELLDHIIVGQEESFSFADSGLLIERIERSIYLIPGKKVALDADLAQ